MIKWIMLICLSLLLFACGPSPDGDYREGHNSAWKSYKLMTTAEKCIYDKVEGVWGKDPLYYLREALRTRRNEAPNDTQLPFKDIADIITSINGTQLVVSNDWFNAATYTAAKFDRVDSSWYNLIKVHALNMPEMPRVEQSDDEEDELTTFEDDIPDEILNKPTTAVDLDQLKDDIRNCESAKDKLMEIISIGKIIDHEVEKEIYHLINLCRAQELKESLED